MFSIPWFKKKEPFKSSEEIAVTRLNWMNELFTEHEGLVHPSWEEIYQHAEKRESEADANELWCNIARTWLAHLVDRLPNKYTRSETANFILLSAQNDSFNETLLNFLEVARNRLLSKGKGILSDDGFGKYVVIAFANNDSYYDYVSYFGAQDGTFGMSSGMYVNQGYGHFVFYESEIDEVELIAAHEMTHAFLSHLPIPLWLNEGMAVSLESAVTGVANYYVNNSLIQEHQAYWSTQKIQEYWEGKSFSSPDKGQRLSYHLAQVMVANMSSEYDHFVEFVNNANWSDGGEKSCQDAFGFSLSDAVGVMLGEGDWSPKLPVTDQR